MCQRFSYPELIIQTKSPNDIIDRSEKHDDKYYYIDNSFFYDDIVKIATDARAIYKTENAGVMKTKLYVCPTLTANTGTFPDRVTIVKYNLGIRRISLYECFTLQAFPPSLCSKESH